MGCISPCPNGSCSHPGWLHDIYELGDPYPTCCAEGCRCGHPGDVVMQRLDGRRVVTHADPVIRVAASLLAADGLDADSWDGETLTLDSAGEYRYELLRRDPRDDRVLVFGRVKPAHHGATG